MAMPAQGGSFYDCVAGGIRWIRLQLRETPCGHKEVSAWGQSGMNSLLWTILHKSKHKPKP